MYTCMFWVPYKLNSIDNVCAMMLMKRDNKFDLSFSNNGGHSKAHPMEAYGEMKKMFFSSHISTEVGFEWKVTKSLRGKSEYKLLFHSSGDLMDFSESLK